MDNGLVPDLGPSGCLVGGVECNEVVPHRGIFPSDAEVTPNQLDCLVLARISCSVLSCDFPISPLHPLTQ